MLVPKQYLTILHELRVHVSDADLQLLPLALQLVVAILVAQPGVLGSAIDELGAPLLELVRSPLLQGTSMKALLEVYATLVRLSPSALDVLLPPLLAPTAATTSPTIVASSKQVRGRVRAQRGSRRRVCHSTAAAPCDR